MSLEENKAIFRRYIDAYNQHNLDALDEFIASDYVDPDYPQLQGLEGLKQMIGMAFKAFPDYHETLEDIIAEGDKLWVLLTYTGTHKGEFMGLPQTGKKFTCLAIDMYRIANGKIVWGKRIPTPDLAFFKQLGFIEYTEQGKQLFPEDAK